MTMPVLYIPHGGGPLPLLDDPSHQPLTRFLQGLGTSLPKPAAILVISAHWEEALPTVQAAPVPDMLFDYYGFPPESYDYRYPAQGAPALAEQIAETLTKSGIDATLDRERGFDHGVFVPLLLMYPQANIPTLQLSLIKGLDAEQHLALGEALEELREQNVLILGSGMSFHNLPALMQEIRGGQEATSGARQESDRFHQWLKESLNLDVAASKPRLANWQTAPGARFSHPRAEHLMPLMVCCGAAGTDARPGIIFDEPLMGHHVLGVQWD